MMLNWKRGALRAWMAVSVVWILAVGYLMYPRTAEYWDTEGPSNAAIKLGAADALACVKLVDPDDLPDKLKADQKGPWMKYQCERVLDGSRLHMKLVDGGSNTWTAVLDDDARIENIPKNADADGIAKLVSGQFASFARHEKFHAVFLNVQWLLIPPLVLFLSGLVFLWVLAGFKRAT